MDPVQRPLLAPENAQEFQDLSIRLTRNNIDQHIADVPGFWGWCCMGSQGSSEIEVPTNRHKILSRCGVITDVLREPRVHYVNSCCLEEQEVENYSWTGAIKSLKVNDSNGMPLWASGTYNYQINHTIDSQYKLQNPSRFVKDQVRTVFQKVLSQYPYDRPRHDNRPSLTRQSAVIDGHLRNMINDMLRNTGWEVTSILLTGIGISENLEKLTLARQIAQSYVTGKKAVAEGAMGIVEKTVLALRAQNIELTDRERDALLTDLLYMICNNDNFALKINKCEQ